MEAQLQKAKEIEAALMAELEQSKAAVSAAEKAKADLEAAERFKADLQPSLESFKGRILALEAELESGDQLAQASACSGNVCCCESFAQASQILGKGK